MPLFVQLPDKKGEPVHHVVVSHAGLPGEDDTLASSRDFKRRYELGCGRSEIGPAGSLAEAEVPPWTNRHVAKGCFTIASDPQD